MPRGANTKLLPLCLDEGACPRGTTFSDWLARAFKDSGTEIIDVVVTGSLYKYNVMVENLFQVQERIGQWESSSTKTTEKNDFILGLLKENETEATKQAGITESTWITGAIKAGQRKFKLPNSSPESQQQSIQVTQIQKANFIGWDKLQPAELLKSAREILNTWLAEDTNLSSQVNIIVDTRVERAKGRFLTRNVEFKLDQQLEEPLKDYCKKYLLNELEGLIIWAMMGYSVILHKHTVNPALRMLATKINQAIKSEPNKFGKEAKAIEFKKLTVSEKALNQAETDNNDEVGGEIQPISSQLQLTNNSPRDGSNVSSSSTASTSTTASIAGKVVIAPHETIVALTTSPKKKHQKKKHRKKQPSEGESTITSNSSISSGSHDEDSDDDELVNALKVIADTYKDDIAALAGFVKEYKKNIVIKVVAELFRQEPKKLTEFMEKAYPTNKSKQQLPSGAAVAASLAKGPLAPQPPSPNSVRKTDDNKGKNGKSTSDAANEEKHTKIIGKPGSKPSSNRCTIL